MNQSDIEFLRTLGLVVMPLVPPDEEGKKPKPMANGWTEMAAEELEKGLSKTNLYGVRVKPPLLVVDVDDKRLARLVEDDFPPTLTVETKDGYHYYYKTEGGHPENMNKSAFIQLLTNNRYAVSPPTVWNGHRYRFVNKAPPATIDGRAVKKLERMLNALGKYENLIREFAAVWSEGHRHNLSLWLNGALRKAGLERFEAALIVKSICLLAGDGELADRLRALSDTYGKPVDSVAGWSRLESELESLIGREKARGLLSLLPRPPEGAKGEEKYTVGCEVVDGVLLELVEGPRLLLLREGGFEVADMFEVGGRLIRPYQQLPFSLPGIPAGLGPDPTLWEETKQFITNYFDAPDPRAYDVITAAIAWSYFFREAGASTPFLLFLGPWRSGKTRALEVLTALAYRAMQVVDLTEASLFRLASELRPTLIVDEANILNPSIISIMCAAYRKGAKIPRVVEPERPGLEGVKWFEIYSLIVYAAREVPRDDVLSRSVVIHCEKALKQTSKTFDAATAHGLRTRWFAQRLRLYGKVNVTYNEFETDDGRIQELLSPLVVMADLFGGRGAVDSVMDFGRTLESELRALETCGEEAELVEAIVKLVQERRPDAPEVVLNREILERLGDGWDPRRLGKTMARLGFRRVKRPGGLRGYRLDYNLLARLCRRYDVDAGFNPPISALQR